jgi:hypothetical protein
MLLLLRAQPLVLLLRLVLPFHPLTLLLLLLLLLQGA